MNNSTIHAELKPTGEAEVVLHMPYSAAQILREAIYHTHSTECALIEASLSGVDTALFAAGVFYPKSIVLTGALRAVPGATI